MTNRVKASDTPETDAAEFCYGGSIASGYVEIDFARRLERERDMALSEAARLGSENRAWVSEIFRLLGLPDGDMGALENYVSTGRDQACKLVDAERNSTEWKARADKWRAIATRLATAVLRPRDVDGSEKALAAYKKLKGQTK